VGGRAQLAAAKGGGGAWRDGGRGSAEARAARPWPLIGLVAETRMWLASGATATRRGFDGLVLGLMRQDDSGTG